MPSFLNLITLAVAAGASSRHGDKDTRWAHWGGSQQNTHSPLGTPSQPHLPHFLNNNPLPQGFPWAGRNAWNTNYYDDCPDTGITRYFDWTISKVPCSPDGYENTCLVANDQFPGPLIQANWGDWIEVKVTNNISDEGTAIHWHGLLQKETPYMDGVPGYDQCPIAPGSTFTYRFKADLYGTTWWHSHYSAQYGSGLFGPMVIYGPDTHQYDEDLGPVMISDYYHAYYETLVEGILAPIGQQSIPFSNNNLINGKTNNGPGPVASFNFTSGKSYRLRLINPSSAAVQKFTIDGYNFTVIANDFVPVRPYETDHVTLAVGQRTDIVVRANGAPTDSVWMRGYDVPACSPTAGNQEVKAAIFYQDADRSKAPTTAPGPNAHNSYCGNDPLAQTVPAYQISAGTPSVTEMIPIEFKANETGHLLWYMANRTFRIDYNDPILLEAKLGNLDFPYIENVHNYGTNRSIRVVLENTGVQPHPMHLHGHNIFILAEGACGSGQNQTVFGDVNGTTIAGQNDTSVRPNGAPTGHGGDGSKGKRGDEDSSYGSCWDGTVTNPGNPQRRDVQMLLPGHYIVIQWNQDNPGTWPLHCHIAWHLSAGFAWSVLENPDAIRTEMQIPSVMAQTCRDWAAWSGTNVVDQIDDGI